MKRTWSLGFALGLSYKFSHPKSRTKQIRALSLGGKGPIQMGFHPEESSGIRGGETESLAGFY